MSTQPRVSSAIAGEPPHFGSVLAHQPVLAARFGALYGALWDSDVLSARTKEICRMRNARVTACGFCRQVRFAKPRSAGLDEAVLDDVTEGYEASTRLTDAEKAALRFTDALIHDPDLLDGHAAEALRQHLGDGQIAELTLAVMLFLALAKVLITLGLEPEQLETTVIPTPAPSALAGEGDTSGLQRIPPAVTRALAARPDLLGAFAAFYGALWEEHLLEPALLDVTARTIARVQSETGRHPDGDAVQAYAARIPFEHHAIGDDEAARVCAELGEAGYVAFSVAAALEDALLRARMVLERLPAPLLAA